jgi:predicted Rossmann fold flavoprotein
MTFDCIVIGGGAAGMMAAGRAGSLGERVLIVEKNDRLGKKLSITGGRRCNITNAEFNNRVFLENFPESKQFLYSPFSKFNVESTFEFFENRDLPIVVEDRKRAFPASQNAEDVCQVLVDYVEESGNVRVELGADFKDFIREEGKLVGIKTSKGDYRGRRFILATGGLAAPETGSTGDWLPILKKIGHTVKDANPNLAPLKTSARWVHKLSGVSADDIQIRFLSAGKSKLKKRGRLLFTHFGISGPLVINSSHEVSKLLKEGQVKASIDFYPDEDLGSMDARLVALFEANKNKQFKNIVRELLPGKLSEMLLTLPLINFGETPVHSITKEQRRALLLALKELEFPITGTMGFEWAIVADGGVIPEEVDFRTMQSRVHSNLYLIGDTININRPSGGFSLQLCWTMGWIAGGAGTSV